MARRASNKSASKSARAKSAGRSRKSGSPRRGRSGRRARRGRGSNPPPRRRSTRRAVAARKRGKRNSLRARLGRWWTSYRRTLLSIGLVLTALPLLAGLALWWGLEHVAQQRSQPGPAVAVSWPAELDALQVAELLHDLELTDSPLALSLYLRVRGTARCIQPGPHLLPRGVSARELLAALCRSEQRPVAKLVVPEGMNRFSLAKRLHALAIADRDAFLHATQDEVALYPLGITPVGNGGVFSAEGYLFPATYPFPINSPPAQVVKRLVHETDKRLTRLLKAHPGGWERLQAERSFTRRELLTLASMVEKEAVMADERPLIASVFLNRLADPAFKHLQSDPTAMYGCLALGSQVAACRGYAGKASGAINRDRDNIYSTYVTAGLPPGAICSPGEAAIVAVLQPAESDYRFFVAKGAGRHTFSRDYAAHLRAIERLRQRRSP